MEAASMALGFAAVIVFAMLVPGIIRRGMPKVDLSGMNASMFSGNAALGYIVTGVIAFALGAAVTLFCLRLRKWEEEKNEESGYDR